MIEERHRLIRIIYEESGSLGPPGTNMHPITG